MVTIVDTGLETMTGGRIKRVQEFIGNETFMLTYGDAVGNIEISKLLNFHRKHGKIGTISMYSYAQNKGVIEADDNGIIKAFREKSDFDGDLINIGFMVFEPMIFNYIEGDATVFEQAPINKLVSEKQLIGYVLKGFWQCMDTLREKQSLEKKWASGNALWKIWN